MASAEFTVNGLTVDGAAAVSASSTVTLALVSSTGVRTVSWSIIGNHSSAATNPTITPAGSPSGATATFPMPSGAAQGYLVQCVINGGVDETGQQVTNYTMRAIVGVLNTATNPIVPFVVGEQYERSATHGIVEDLNAAASAVGGGSGDIKSDGSVAFAANQSMGSHKLTNLTNGGTGTQDAASVAQVEALIAASTSNVADWKQSVRAATTANITLSGAQTIDGVSVIAGDRVLVKSQSTGSQNGIYVAASGAWSRATDADVSSEVTCGLTCLVEEGTANGGKPFILTTANPITLGSTSLTFTALQTVTAGNGLTGTSSLSVLANGTTLTVGASGVKLRDGAAAGQEPVWDGSAWWLIGRKTGSALGDASVTLQFTTAAQYIWPAATNATATRTLTLGTTGLSSGPNAGVGAIVNIFFLRANYSNNVVVANGGAGAGTLFTVPSGGSDPIVASFYYDGTNWALAGWEFLATVTAA